MINTTLLNSQCSESEVAGGGRREGEAGGGGGRESFFFPLTFSKVLKDKRLSTHTSTDIDTQTHNTPLVSKQVQHSVGI